MKTPKSDVSSAEPRTIDGDQSLVLHMDNTTLHRLRYLVDPNAVVTANLKMETLNVLHLLETLVLADDITVSSFESEPSQEISNALIEALRPVRRSDGTALVQPTVNSSWELQLEIAKETAAEIVDRGLLSFNPYEDKSLLAHVNVTTARPDGVVEPTARFWDTIFQRKATHDDVRAEAVEEVHLHRTDALFLFGIADTDDFRTQVLDSYARFGAWSEEHWNRLHVLFRAFSNQRIADRIPGAVYSPPPVRADVLTRVNSRTLRRFKETLAELAVAVARHPGTPTSDQYPTDLKMPIPILGLAVLPHGSKSVDQLVARLLKVREEATDLRNCLRRLSALYISGENDKAFREIERECAALKRGVAERLGLTNTTSLPAAAIDTAVHLSSAGVASVPDLSGAAKLLDWFSALSIRRRKRVQFLANLVARSAEEPGIERASMYISRRQR